MHASFRTKLLYLGALFALGMLAILARLYSMQVIDRADYRASTEIVRSRRSLLFAPRARILSADGEVLASNESSWECTVNFWEFSDPAYVIHRARLTPAAYPPLDSLMRFHKDYVLPLDNQKAFAAPRRARQFFAGWKVRRSDCCRRDTDIALAQLARMANLPLEELRAKMALIAGEVDALEVLLGDPQAAPGAAVQRAYIRAREALTDLEYWERMRRYPTSMHLEVQLERRLEWALKRQQLSEALAESIGERPDLAFQLVSAALQRCRNEAGALAATPDDAPAAEPAPAEPGSAWKDWASANEARAAWLALEAEFGKLLASCGDHARAEAAAKAMIEAFDDSGGEIRKLGDRLRRLRERVLDPWREDYLTRWRAYLTPDANGRPALIENPLRLARRISRETAEALALNEDVLPGVECAPRATRLYPHAELLPHAIGNMALPDAARIEELSARDALTARLGGLIERWYDGEREQCIDAFRGSLARQETGAWGVERAYDERLSGEPGARVAYADARGRERSVEFEESPLPAGDLYLTIDGVLQRYAMERIAAWEPKLRQKAMSGTQASVWRSIGPNEWCLRGALVVLDVETGAVLALVNMPSFDPVLLHAPGEAGDAYRHEVLHGDDKYPASLHWLKRAPLLDRATGARYAPGSTFKVLSAIAMLEEGVLDAGSSFNDCSDVYEGHGFRLRSGHPAHREIDIVDALAASSNAFFWHFSERMPGSNALERYQNCLYPWARRFGFSEKPGLDLAGQTPGFLPGPDSRTVTPGELAQLCIGQGQNLTSPLQIARLMAAVAARGRLIAPRLGAEAPVVERLIEARDTTWDIVHRGMRGVVFDSEHGTAKRSQSCRRIQAAAKTGTAQNGKFRAADGQLRDVPDHAWFAGFAPCDPGNPAVKPRVAFALLGAYSDLAGGDLADLAGEIAGKALERLECRAAAANTEASTPHGPVVQAGR